MRAQVLFGAVALLASPTVSRAAKPAAPVSTPKNVKAEALMKWVEDGCRFFSTGYLPAEKAAPHFGRILREVRNKALRLSKFDVEISALPGWPVSVDANAVSVKVPATIQIKVSELEQRWGKAELGEGGDPLPFESKALARAVENWNGVETFNLEFRVHRCLIAIEAEGRDEHSARLKTLWFTD